MCVIYNDGPGSQDFCDVCDECVTLKRDIRADFIEADIPLEDKPIGVKHLYTIHATISPVAVII